MVSRRKTPRRQTPTNKLQEKSEPHDQPPAVPQAPHKIASAGPPPKVHNLEAKQSEPIVPHAHIQGIEETCYYIAREVFRISALVLRILRIPIALVLVFLLSTFLLGELTLTIRRTVRPLCIFPGISGSVLCLPLDPVPPPTGGPRIAEQADYPALVNIQSKAFEDLLEDAAGGPALSLEIKKAEMAISDLTVRVRVSNLRSKEDLVSTLDEFVADAVRTGRGLQKLTAKVGGSVENIIAVNNYALQSIGEARADENAPWSFSSIAPWRPPRKSVDEIVKRTFNEAMDALSKNMARLIVEAELSHTNLINLEEKLATLHDIVTREDSHISAERSEVLGELWTILGGNRDTIRNFDDNLALLKGLSEYRKEALVHVVGALQTLRAMSADMEDMRERVATPELVGAQVPVEVHIKSIQMGLDRLKEGRMTAKRVQGETVRKVQFD